MATFSTFANRLLVAGGFAVAVAAAPLALTLTATAAPTSPVLASCPANEILDPVSGACRPISDVPAPGLNPINPENAPLQPGSITSGGNVGQLPEVDGIPCTGANTGKCIGLEESAGGGNPAEVKLPPVPVGVQP